MNLFICVTLLLSLTGCVNVASVIKAMSNDSATVHVSIRTVYGVVDIDRVNAGTNTPSHSIKPDGSINVR
jgi:hypothetical protein